MNDCGETEKSMFSGPRNRFAGGIEIFSSNDDCATVCFFVRVKKFIRRFLVC